jgi:hypothetical protein
MYDCAVCSEPRCEHVIEELQEARLFDLENQNLIKHLESKLLLASEALDYYDQWAGPDSDSEMILVDPDIAAEAVIAICETVSEIKGKQKKKHSKIKAHN